MYKTTHEGIKSPLGAPTKSGHMTIEIGSRDETQNKTQTPLPNDSLTLPVHAQDYSASTNLQILPRVCMQS